MSIEETKEWYDGYHFQDNKYRISIYSPKSVVEAMLRYKFGPYWNRTETYEALKVYIQMNFDGLKDAIITMLAKEKRYAASLEEYKDNLLLVGINYNKGTEIHTCEIERWKVSKA